MAERTEEEQIEAIKRWWQKNWHSIVFGVGLAVLLLAGWQFWQNQQAASRTAAQQSFDGIINALSMQDETERRATLEYLLDEQKSNYRRSVYTIFSAMVAGSFFAEEGDYEEAIAQFQWALDNAGDHPMPLVIRERLARAQLAAGEMDAALATLDGVDDPGRFAPLFHELRGDVLRLQGNLAEAREAYEQARDSREDGRADPLLDLKLSDLAVSEDA